MTATADEDWGATYGTTFAIHHHLTGGGDLDVFTINGDGEIGFQSGVSIKGFDDSDSIKDQDDYVPTSAAVKGYVDGKVPEFFVSTEQTGTGGEDTVAHGLSGTPAYTMVSITDDNNAAFTWSESSIADGTNVYITVTSNAKYKVLSIYTP